MCGAETMSLRPRRLEESPESLPFARRADGKRTENKKKKNWGSGGRGGGHKELSEAGSEVRRIKVGVRISGQ